MAMLATGISIYGADTPVTGMLKGRILDNENNPLPGAVVTIDGNSRSAVADADGFYSFASLTAGNHALRVTYIGFAPSVRTVIIKGPEMTQDFVMTDKSRELKEVVVTGVFSGQRRAINTQKNNINITNVVSADQIGKFPDSNIGDALKRISGINVQYDQGEV